MTKITYPKKCPGCGEIDSIIYQDKNNNIIYPKCIKCGAEAKKILLSSFAEAFIEYKGFD
tara:strand:+ start:127 stop:306 length:180 start_codon:yes stop_codon:yes gene_type:complete